MKGAIAIIGANGFVGRHLVALLTAQRRPALGVVRSEHGARVVSEYGGTPFRVPDLQVKSLEGLAPALQGCAGLVYTAAVAAPSSGALDRTDPSGLVNVISACRESGVPRIVFLSGLGIAHYGMNPHCTNPYFLAKMAGEVTLFRSGLEVTVLRPSYIFGTGDEFLSPLIQRMSGAAAVEIPGDGAYRLQPVSVRDAARAILASLDAEAPAPHRVVDLVGPEMISFRALVGRVAVSMRQSTAILERPVEEALAQARASGYFGLRPHDLACLLCDEVSDPRPVEALLGGPLETLDEMVLRTITEVRAAEARP